MWKKAVQPESWLFVISNRIYAPWHLLLSNPASFCSFRWKPLPVACSGRLTGYSGMDYSNREYSEQEDFAGTAVIVWQFHRNKGGTGYSCAGSYGFGHVCLIFRKFWLCAWKERADRKLFYIIYWKCRFSWHLLPCMNSMRDWFFEEFACTAWTDSMEFHWEAGILKMFHASWLRLTGRLRMKKEGRGFRNYKYYCKKRPGFQ